MMMTTYPISTRPVRRMSQKGKGKNIPLTVEVPSGEGERVRSLIMRRGLFDPGRNIGRWEGLLFFPILIDPNGELPEFEGKLREMVPAYRVLDSVQRTPVRRERTDPYGRVLQLLAGRVPPSLIGKLPTGWEMLGDALVLRLPGELEGYRETVARSYMEVLGARYCLGNSGGVEGELRIPTPDVIIPPADGRFEVVHTENSIDYHLDPRKVMFSPGNVDERIRASSYLKDIPTDGEGHGEVGKAHHVLDMFAGIGYFSLPIARSSERVRVTAVEKNPAAYGYLEKNIEVNGLSRSVEPILGDNREVEPGPLAHRIVMGYVGGTVDYLEAALDRADPGGCIIHLHDTVPVEVGVQGLFRRAKKILEGKGWEGSLVRGRRIKSYAPGIYHVVVDIRTGRT